MLFIRKRSQTRALFLQLDSLARSEQFPLIPSRRVVGPGEPTEGPRQCDGAKVRESAAHESKTPRNVSKKGAEIRIRRARRRGKSLARKTHATDGTPAKPPRRRMGVYWVRSARDRRDSFGGTQSSTRLRIQAKVIARTINKHITLRYRKRSGT